MTTEADLTNKPEQAVPSSDLETTNSEVILDETENQVEAKKNENMTDFVLELFTPSEQTTNLSSNDTIEIVKPIQMISENIENGTVIDLPEEEMVNPNIMSGQAFIEWLRQGIATKRLSINVKNAKLHIVKNHLFLVTPGIFTDYFNSKGVSYTKKDIESLQYAFQDLKLHKRYHLPNKDSQNFWKCSVIGPRKSSKLVGYLIKDTEYFFGKQVLIDNLHLTLIEEKQNE
ncbi:hypothetical protein HD_0898 [[Haemophilus] ducreyi 35000HP]|uniref:Putative conjugal transfer nickase/helicase TraI C-terminal domain-containing protein n=1 Tax=Haemophilus ducreyi (strain 35000HP / ATCC 700724) TaxID=233412 RepID=Q7VMS1_HAEDU|nr:hypothetical protein HD_0898 [[Haemophilus] ducreyi 35000HP]